MIILPRIDITMKKIRFFNLKATKWASELKKMYLCNL